MPIVLGINAYHGDASACLMADGQLVAAAEEERFRRIKHWAGFPSEAIGYCLEAAGVTWRQVEHVAINRDPRANLLRKMAFVLKQRPQPRLVFERLRNQGDWSGVESRIHSLPGGAEFNGQIHHIEHHLAHLASAFLVSPFERAITVSVDALGDFTSACWGIGEGGAIRIAGRVYSPHSLGIFYEAMTQYLGFPQFGDEYKVMGLASYGAPDFVSKMKQVVQSAADGTFRLDLDYFRHHKERVGYTWRDCAPTVERLFSPALENLLGPARGPDQPLGQRHRDIARSVQTRYEEAFFAFLNAIHRHAQIDALALAGGCAMNSVANGKICSSTPFKRVYVQAAAGDAGGALGAALIVSHRLMPHQSRFVMEHAYWGPRFEECYLGTVVERNRSVLAGQDCVLEKIPDPGELCRRTAHAIAAGQVVGWFQGRMEWGPRALGNRSILCDPRRSDMKELLNLKIKRRESFRPFAPSILREHVADWFELDAEVPFMTQVLPIRATKRALIPAVTHVDGSGRLHTVSRDANPLYYRLIESFFELTNIPLLLNTSFNENEPIVCRPEEALDCFVRTKMDLLVLGSYMIRRKELMQQPSERYELT